MQPVYQPVVKPVEQPVGQPVVSCIQTFNRLYKFNMFIHATHHPTAWMNCANEPSWTAQP